MDDVLELVKEYERNADVHRRGLSEYIDSVILNNEELLSRIFEVFEFTKTQNIPITFIDKLPEIINQLTTQEHLSDLVLNFHESIESISSSDLELGVNNFKSLKDKLSTLPLTKGPLFEELKSNLSSKKALLAKNLSSRLESEFLISKTLIRVSESFKTTKKLLKDLEEWENLAKKYHQQVFSFFQTNSSNHLKAKPLINQFQVKVSKRKCLNFSSKVQNFETFLNFFSTFFEISPTERFWTDIVTDLVIAQAECCLENEELRAESLKQAKILQDLVHFSANPPNLLKIIENSKEFRLRSTCVQKLESQQQLLLKLRETETRRNCFTITESCETFLQVTSSYFAQPLNSESELLLVLKSVKHSFILFQVLRSSKALYESRSLALQLSDTEFIHDQLEVFSSTHKDSKEIPEYLSYLLDYSDLATLLEIDLAKIRERLVEINQEELKNICKPLNFSLFEENSKFQEQVLLRGISFIRENFILKFLPLKLSSGLIGSVIDTLIELTVDQILQKDDIYLKDFQTIKHFFTLIFNIRDVFQGENPTRFCLKWDKLEALLGIIEGSLVDILKLFKARKFEGLFNLRELRKLIEALFEDNEKRRAALSQIN